MVIRMVIIHHLNVKRFNGSFGWGPWAPTGKPKKPQSDLMLPPFAR